MTYPLAGPSGGPVGSRQICRQPDRNRGPRRGYLQEPTRGMVLRATQRWKCREAGRFWVCSERFAARLGWGRCRERDMREDLGSEASGQDALRREPWDRDVLRGRPDGHHTWDPTAVHSLTMTFLVLYRNHLFTRLFPSYGFSRAGTMPSVTTWLALQPRPGK